MTWQARCYFAALSLRHAGIASMILFSGLSFPEGSHQFIKQIQPLGTWAAVMLIVAAAAAGAVVTGAERWARWVLVASCAVTAIWALGFIAAGVDGSLTAPTAPIVWSALVIKDLLIAASDLTRLDLTRLDADAG